MPKTILFVIGFLLLAIVVGFASYKLAINKVVRQQPTGIQDKVSITSTPPLPTKTKEELEIISKIENHFVEIKNNQFNPQVITVKVNDQVFWTNNDTVDHQVEGDDWGGVRISAGQRFMQVFKKPGNYEYTCSIHPEMKGTVVVK